MKKLINKILARYGYLPEAQIAKFKADLIKQQPLELAVVDDKGCCTPHYLGIDPVRLDELRVICVDAMNKNGRNINFAIKEASKQAKHQNELVISCFMVAELDRIMKNPLQGFVEFTKNQHR